jgi:hypothetical protein
MAPDASEIAITQQPVSASNSCDETFACETSATTAIPDQLYMVEVRNGQIVNTFTRRRMVMTALAVAP